MNRGLVQVSSTASPRKALRRSRVPLAVIVAGALFAGSTAVAGGVKAPFVTAKVSLNQTVRALIHGKFTERVTCAQSCKIIARVFISSEAARKLGFKGVKSDEEYAIGLVQKRLAADKASVVRMPVSAQARTRLRKASAGLRLMGETYASATGSNNRGQANWITILRR